MFPKEGFCCLQDVDLGRTVAESVTFIFKLMHLNRDAVGSESCCHAFRLLRWHHLVLQSLEKQATCDFFDLSVENL